MRQFLRGQRKIRDDEHRQLADSHEDDSGIAESTNTPKVVTTPSPIAKEVNDAGIPTESEPDFIGEYEESREGKSPEKPDSRISTLSAQIAPFEVPTRRFPLSSGFPYHRQLFHFKVSPDEWSRFTDDITRASSLSKLARWAVWGTGITVGATSAALTIFGIPPGYYAGKAVYSKAVEKKVRQGLKEEGEIEAIMKFWNETVFMKKGCRVRLQLPTRKKDKENVDDNGSDNGSTEETSKAGSENGEKDSGRKNKPKKTDKFFKLIVEPLMEETPSGPLVMSPGLDRLKEAALREINEHSANRNTISSVPSPATTEPPAYAPGTFVPELEANSPGTAVESCSREIREMPGSSKTLND